MPTSEVVQFPRICTYCEGSERKVGPTKQACIFLGYGEDKFGNWLWDLDETNIIKSRDIVYMEEKSISNWETTKKGIFFKLIHTNQLDETRIHPVASRMLDEEQSGPTGFGQATESTYGEPDDGIT